MNAWGNQLSVRSNFHVVRYLPEMENFAALALDHLQRALLRADRYTKFHSCESACANRFKPTASMQSDKIAGHRRADTNPAVSVFAWLLSVELVRELLFEEVWGRQFAWGEEVQKIIICW